MARTAADASLPRAVALGCLLAGLLVFPHPAAAQFAPAPADSPVGELYRVEMLGTLWSPARDLNVASLTSDASGATLDTNADPGAGSPRFADLRIRLRLRRQHRIHLDYLPVRYAADTTLDRGLVLGGIGFEPGVPVDSTLTWKTWRLAYEYDVIHLARGYLGLLGEVRYTDIEVALDRACGAGPSACNFTRRRRLAPAVGGVIRLYPSPVIGLAAEASLLQMPPGADQLFGHPGKHLSYDVYATLNFLQPFGLQVGYRSLNLSLETDEQAADLKLQGVYAGALLRF